MTFSIVGRSADGQALGVAVASRFLAVGAAVPAAEAQVGAIATQSYANLAYRPQGLALLRTGVSATGTVAGLTAANGAATLAVFTAAAVARSLSWLPEPPALWLVTGGGRRNKFLMEQLAWHLEAPVAPVEAIELDGDSMEAEAWAYLAVRSLKGLPISYPGTTGAPYPLTGGVLARAP